MEHGEDDLDRGSAFALLDVDRDAAAVVDDPDAAVGREGDVDPVAVPGHGFVDGVVHDFVDEVMQAAFARGADVHTRPLANCFQTLQHSDRTGVVGHAVLLWLAAGAHKEDDPERPF